MHDLGQQVAGHHIDLSTIEAPTYQLALTTWIAIREAKDAAEQTEEKRRAAVRQAANATRGNNT